MEPLIEPPFRLFDELEKSMSEQGSLYLGPDFTGRYMVRTCRDGAGVYEAYTFEALRTALLGAGFSEATDADDFDAAFYVGDVGLWTSGMRLLLVPHEQVEALAFAAAYIAEHYEDYAYTGTEAFSDFERATAQKVWEGLLPSDRRNLTRRVQGHRYTRWDSAMADGRYQELIDDLLRD